MINDPEAGVVKALFGSDSQVVTPLNFRMYLYWMLVLAGRERVTMAFWMSLGSVKIQHYLLLQIG